MMESRFVALILGHRAAEIGVGLEALGVRVLHAEDSASLFAVLDSEREVSVLVLSSDVGREVAAAVLAAAKTRYVSLPSIWLGASLGGAPLADFRTSPDILMNEPVLAEEVHQHMMEILQRSYTDTIAELLVEVTGDALRDSSSAVSTTSPVRVNSLHRLVNDVNTIIAFCGNGISGRLLVSAEEATLLSIRGRTMSAAGGADRRAAEDLVGEIANLAAGKLKYAFDQLGVECEIGTPLMVGSAGMIVRPSRGQPSLCVDLGSVDGCVRGELSIDRCDDARLAMLSAPPVRRDIDQESEVCFF
ncbi:MAG: chemotaxis protein CheX [Minicystis sp.]